jgi:acyl-CoA reductase-like NAD-dependent aldehyde dehydrogenase
METPVMSLLRVAELAVDAGFPAGCINIVTGYGHEWATRWRVTRASTTSASLAADGGT